MAADTPDQARQEAVAHKKGMPAEGSLVDRIANMTVTVVPLALVGYAAWLAWGGVLNWQSVLIFFATLIPFGLGITVGFHRLFIHRSFKTSAPMRGLWAVLGSMALEGPVIEWVAYHRRHHAFSDEEGDPHSPHVGHGEGWRGALSGLFYAHVGWVLFSTEPAEEERYAPDLMADPVVRFVDRTFVLWAVPGLAIPFGCHFFGTRAFVTGDESRNIGCWRRSPSARPGTTTITPFPPRRATGLDGPS